MRPLSLPPVLLLAPVEGLSVLPMAIFAHDSDSSGHSSRTLDMFPPFKTHLCWSNLHHSASHSCDEKCGYLTLYRTLPFISSPTTQDSLLNVSARSQSPSQMSIHSLLATQPGNETTSLWRPAETTGTRAVKADSLEKHVCKLKQPALKVC